MNITIEGPAFYDQEDENIFFSCIYNIPGYKQVNGHGLDLTISFNQKPCEHAVIQLLVICRRWGVSTEPLNVFKNEFNPGCFLWDNSILQEDI